MNPEIGVVMLIEIFFAGMTGGFTLVGDSGQAASLSHKVKGHIKINFYLLTRFVSPVNFLICSLTTRVWTIHFVGSALTASCRCETKCFFLDRQKGERMRYILRNPRRLSSNLNWRSRIASFTKSTSTR